MLLKYLNSGVLHGKLLDTKQTTTVVFQSFFALAAIAAKAKKPTEKGDSSRL